MKKALFYTVNGNYIQLTAVSLTSVILNIEEDFPLDVIIVSNDISPENKQALLEILTIRTTKVTLLFRMLPRNVGEELREISKVYDNVVCWRLFMPHYLKGYSKLLYLDSDTIVYKGFEEIFDLLPQDKSLGVVQDFLAYITEGRKGGWNAKYFNSGVLVMDVVNYTQYSSEERILKELRASTDRYIDQDYLNKVFQESAIHLPLRFNYQKNDKWLKEYVTFKEPERLPYLVEERKQVKIRHFIHFGQKAMPWQKIEVGDSASEDFWNVWGILKKHNLELRKNIENGLEMEQNQKILGLLEVLCDNFKWSETGNNGDIASGLLLGQYSVYWKYGDDYWSTIPNEKKGLVVFHSDAASELHLDIFKQNFLTKDANGNPEHGWCGETLFEMLKYIERKFIKSEELPHKTKKSQGR